MGQLLVRFPEGIAHACEQLDAWRPFRHEGVELGWCSATRLDADAVLAIRRADSPDDIVGATFPSGTTLTELHARTVLDAFGGASGLRASRSRKPQLQSQARTLHILPGLGFISDQEVTNFLSQQYRVPTIDLGAYEVQDEIVALLPKELCARHAVLPVSRAGGSLIVAMVDPQADAALAELALVSGFRIEPVIATEAAIRSAIERYYPDPALR